MLIAAGKDAVQTGCTGQHKCAGTPGLLDC
eukprot:COSAG06_NODE_20736_length_783_cov_1.862573_2_plen_29_part_01